MGVTDGSAGSAGASRWLLRPGDTEGPAERPGRWLLSPEQSFEPEAEARADDRRGARRGRDFRREGSGRSGGGASPTGLRFPRAGRGAVGPC